MKKILFTLVVLGLTTAALTGCRASGEIDPDAASSISLAR